MSDKRRSINTKIWDDSFFNELTPEDKLLFLYLITNSLTNLTGIYEISLKRISFDTGLPFETISNGLKGFERVKKVFYKNGFIILSNFLKNQELNSNMWKGASTIFKLLPNELIQFIIGNDLKGFETLYKPFQSLSNGSGKLKGKLKGKNIYMDKNISTEKKQFIIPTIEEIKSYLLEKNINSFTAEKFYNFYDSKGWMVGKNKMKNWKSAVNTWIENNDGKKEPMCEVQSIQTGATKTITKKEALGNPALYHILKDC